MEEERAAAVRTEIRIPLRFGDGFAIEATAFTFANLVDGREHLALGLGDHAGVARPLVRLHSECLTGDVFGSARCDCGAQLRDAVERIGEAGGFVLYLRQEGRDIGLYNKLDAYALQDLGMDTFEANRALHLPEDARDYRPAAQMLLALGRSEIDLLSNNPDKAAQLEANGVRVHEMVPTGVFVTDENRRYLEAKIQVAGHRISTSDSAA